MFEYSYVHSYAEQGTQAMPREWADCINPEKDKEVLMDRQVNVSAQCAAVGKGRDATLGVYPWRS